MAAVWLCDILLPIKPINQMASRLFGARFACGYRLSVDIVHLFGILTSIKPTNQMTSRLFGFSRLVLIHSC